MTVTWKAHMKNRAIILHDSFSISYIT